MQNQIPAVIKNVYEEFLGKDNFLLEHDVSERAIGHRFALYLEKYFPEYHIDCEYNRDGIGDRPKVLRNLARSGEDSGLRAGKPRKVYPDIIVHKRGEAIGIIAIEFQKSNKTKKRKDYDALKLKAYKDELRYSYAFLITLPIKKNLKNIGPVGDLIKDI